MEPLVSEALGFNIDKNGVLWHTNGMIRHATEPELAMWKLLHTPHSEWGTGPDD